MSDTPVETPHEIFARGLVGQRVAGRYVVEKVLGKGGMGCVTAGTYPELEQRVAIKFMWPELCENVSLATRFVREARLAAKITSPHLVRVFDVGRLDNGTPYLVMERLDGNDLGEEVDTRGLLPIEDVADYLLQALQGLAEIHSRSIVHRDLKPPNLFLAREGGARIVKVLDFGISKETNVNKPMATALTTESILGTPHYMSPEQVKDSRDVDPRSDIWSLGVILYELLTGRLPFSIDATSFGEVFGRILFTDAPKPTTLRPEIPAALEAIVMKCLERERETRWKDVGDLALALAPYARAENRHRADVVKRVLGADHPVLSESSPRIELPPTVAEKGTPRAPIVVPASVPAASAKQLASSTQSAWDNARSKPPSGRRAVVAIVAVGIAAIGIVIFLVARAPSAATPTNAGSATAASTSAPVQSVTPSASLASTAIVLPTPTAPSASASAAGVAVTTPKKLPALVPVVHPPVTTSAKPPPDLVLDRK